MTKCKCLLLAIVLLAAGCTDNVETVTREFRATTNEAIDALTMITNDTQAGRMMTRVFKPMAERYTAIDRKLTIVKSNRDKPEFAKEILESDGVQIYLTDLQVNRQRYSLEITRLRNLYKQYQDRERELLGNDDFNPKDVCPNLHDILFKPMVLDSLRKQLTSPEILAFMIQFPKWNVKGYDAMYLKFVERRTTFVPKNDIKLVW